MSGTLEADDERAAATQLKKRGYHPFEIRRHRGASDLRALFSRRLGAGDLALFSRQMATMVGSGVGLGEALRLVSAQISDNRFREALEDVRGRVEGGESLSAAMGSHRSLFPPLLVSVVSAGEAGGMLAEVLSRTAGHYEALEDIKGKVAAALIYPAFLFAVGVISVAVLVTFVVPGFAELFAGLGQTLPWTTRALLAVSGFMSRWWLVLLSGVVIFAVAFHRVTRSGPGRRTLDALKLEIPLVRRLIIKTETARFARTLSALLSNGVGMLAALDVVLETIANTRIVADILKVRDSVQGGTSLAEALGKHTEFAEMALSLVRVGESSGATPEMLDKIALVCDRDVDRAARALTTLLEPLLIIVMAGAVAFVVMSILLPVFNLNLMIQ